MLDPEQFFTWDTRENKAVAELCPVLDRVIATGLAASVVPFPTSLSSAELTAVAVRLCNRAESNVAVLRGDNGSSLTLVPLFASFRPRPRADMHEPRASRRETYTAATVHI
jgi:hypothetical protein